MATGDVVPDSEIHGSGGSTTTAAPPPAPGGVAPDETVRGDDPDAGKVGYGDAVASGLILGTPGARAAAAAAETYLPRWLSGAPKEASDVYQENYARIGKEMETSRKEAPWTTGIAAAVPGTVAAVAAPEAWGGSLLRTTGTNALWGAGTAANEGDQAFDPSDVANRAGWGAVTGGSAAMMTSGLGSLLLPYGAAGRDVLLAAAKARGVDIPNYIGSISPLMQRFGQLGRSFPVTGEKVADATSKMVKQMGESAQLQAGAASPYTAGAAAKAALEDWIKPTTNAKIDQLYTNASNLMNANVTTPLTNTAAKLAQLAKVRGTYNDQLTGSAVSKINNAIQAPGSGLTYEGIKNLRTEIGRMGSFGSLLPNELPDSEVSQLYGALSKDLDASALRSGGPQAQAAHKFANDTYSQIADQRKQLVSLLGGEQGGAGAENVFSAIKGRASGRPGSGDLDLLRLAKQSILQSNNPGAWDDMGNGMLSVLGRKGGAPNGDFSPLQFLTDVKGLSEEGKNELFGASGPQREVLDTLGTLAERYKQAGRFANPSGTGHVIAGAAVAEQVIDHLSTILSHPVTTTGAIVGGLAGSSALGSYLAKPATAGAVSNFLKQHASWMAQPTEENMNRLRYAAARLSASAASQFGVTVGPAALVSAVAGLRKEWAKNGQ